MSVTPAEVAAIALSFPGAVAGTTHGRPSFYIGKRFFTWVRAEVNSLVAHLDSIDERDMLIESDPALFHITEHYRNYPIVLVRLEKADRELVRAFLTRRFRAIAPKKLLRAFDAA
jgi:hypothetical protein